MPTHKKADATDPTFPWAIAFFLFLATLMLKPVLGLPEVAGLYLLAGACFFGVGGIVVMERQAQKLRLELADSLQSLVVRLEQPGAVYNRELAELLSYFEGLDPTSAVAEIEYASSVYVAAEKIGKEPSPIIPEDPVSRHRSRQSKPF